MRFFGIQHFRMDPAVEVGDELFGIIEGGIESIDSFFIEGFAVHTAEEISIDFGGIERITEVVQVLADVGCVHEIPRKDCLLARHETSG